MNSCIKTLVYPSIGSVGMVKGGLLFEKNRGNESCLTTNNCIEMLVPRGRQVGEKYRNVNTLIEVS